jgi:hypothetical protein
MIKHFKLIVALFFVVSISSCATRGIPLTEQALSFSNGEYVKIGSTNGQDIYVSNDIKNISSQEITSALKDNSQNYQLVKAKESNSFLLKEKNPNLVKNVLVVIGSNNSPTLVESSLSEKKHSVLIQSSDEFYSKKLSKENKDTQYAH